MKRYKSGSEIKNLAKCRLTGHFSNAVFALVLVSMVTRAATNLVITLIPGGGILWDIIAILFSTIVSVVLGILQTGIACYFLNIACGKHATYNNIFYGFHALTEKSLKVSLVRVLAETICLLPYQILFLLFMQTTDTRYLMPTGIALILGYLILFPIDLALSQVYYLLLDFPDSSAGEILSTSIRVMKGHKWRLFCLELSFLPLALLCVLSLGIGFLWLNPYMQMSYTMFFLNLMNPEGTTNEI